MDDTATTSEDASTGRRPAGGADRGSSAGAVLSPDCPSRPVLDQVGDKWSLLVMALLERPLRFNEIRRRLDGVTQRVLTQTLRRLERNGLVRRRVLATSPVGVEYALTALGESLREPFGHLHDWAVDNAVQIAERRAEYDRRTATDRIV